MRRGVLLLFAFVFTCNTLAAQSLARVLADTEMKEFKWAKGVGETLEAADQDAIRMLSEMAGMTTIVNTKDVKIDVSGEGSETYASEANSVASSYFENMRREILREQPGRVEVLRYIPIADWESRHDAARNKIEEYITCGKYATEVEERIRNYAWALVLMHYYTGDTPIKVNGEVPARQWLVSELHTILRDVEVKVVKVDPNPDNRNYPYTVSLDFTYNDEPIGYLQFGYFDGSGRVEGESIKDGRGIIDLKQLPSELVVDLDCYNLELARQMDPTAYELLKNATPLDGSSKSVRTDLIGKAKPPKKPVEIESEVESKLAETKNTFVEVKAQLGDTAPYTKLMTDIVGSIKGLSTSDISHHFTPSAWEHYKKIVASGNPVLARDPEYEFIKHDSLVICRSLPLKLKFSGNRSFVEDVVFRVNEKSCKVESVAYALGIKTESTIRGMEWEDAARMTLLIFLEDYRSAYCLQDLPYIEKVFADDAYIVVGRVLKPSTKKFPDAVTANQGERTVYEKKSKAQYIADLRRSFGSKEFVNIRFEECNVAKGFYAKEGIYAVQVRQLYYSNNYADDGILTLAIDMRQDTNPLVRVRVWQQERDVNYRAEDMINETVQTGNSI